VTDFEDEVAWLRLSARCVEMRFSAVSIARDNSCGPVEGFSTPIAYRVETARSSLWVAERRTDEVRIGNHGRIGGGLSKASDKNGVPMPSSGFSCGNCDLGSRRSKDEANLLSNITNRAGRHAQDKKDCQDSPLISPLPGSVITDCKDSADDTFNFSMPGAGSKKVEGEFHYLEYRHKPASNAQLARNLGTALRTAGYTIVFESQGHDKLVGHMAKPGFNSRSSAMEKLRSTSSRNRAHTGYSSERGRDVQRPTNSGHSVVNGILFDTGKAEVKPESAPAMEEVVKLLKQNAA